MKTKKEPIIKKRWVCPFDEYTGKDKKAIRKPLLFSSTWLSLVDIYRNFKTLKSFKCSPAIRLVGGKWRVYINFGTDAWEESTDIHSAFRKAFKVWKKKGMKTENDSRIVLYIRENKENCNQWLTAEWRIV